MSVNSKKKLDGDSQMEVTFCESEKIRENRHNEVKNKNLCRQVSSGNALKIVTLRCIIMIHFMAAFSGVASPSVIV